MFFRNKNFIKVFIAKDNKLNLDADCTTPENLSAMIVPVLNVCKNVGFTKEYLHNLVDYVFETDIDKLKLK